MVQTGTWTTTNLTYTTTISNTASGYIWFTALQWAEPEDVEIPDNRANCKTGWLEATRFHFDEVRRRSAKRLTRGWTRENVGCWNYSRAPA
jgi:hypothetical protein